MLGIIPGSQGHNSYIVRGLGNEASLNSASHGAGRQMSRKHAMQTIPKKQRDAWLRAARLAKLTITGFNLFTYFITTSDRAVVETVERQSGVKLLPLTRSLL